MGGDDDDEDTIVETQEISSENLFHRGASWVAPSRAKVSWSRRACVAARPGSQEGPQGCTVAGRLLGEGVALLAGRVGRWRAAHLVWLPAAAAC